MDRNLVGCIDRAINIMSLSARRAWIEIAVQELIPLADPVALRKESVDRNLIGCVDRTINIMSLSARRAWIEMSRAANCQHRSHRRSPQGERG